MFQNLYCLLFQYKFQLSCSLNMFLGSYSRQSHLNYSTWICFGIQHQLFLYMLSIQQKSHKQNHYKHILSFLHTKLHRISAHRTQLKLESWCFQSKWMLRMTKNTLIWLDNLVVILIYHRNIGLSPKLQLSRQRTLTSCR